MWKTIPPSFRRYRQHVEGRLDHRAAFAGDVAFAGALSANTPKEITFTPLITTSTDNACLVDQMNAQFGMSAMRAQLKPDGAQRILAARLQGTFKTAFPNGLSTNGTETATNAVPTHLTSGTSTVMVFGDADFLNDRFCVQVMNSLFGQVAQPINDNLTLFGNTVEQLAGREELIGVRSRGQFNRPFVKVDELEVKAMKQWQAEEERLEPPCRNQQRLSDLQQNKSGNERLILSRSSRPSWSSSAKRRRRRANSSGGPQEPEQGYRAPRPHLKS